MKEATPSQKYETRQRETLPLLNDFKLWLDKSALQVPPKSALGKAIGYSLNQWSKLSRFVKDSHLSIDNNRAELAIKRFEIGRKAWLFSHAQNGAEVSAILYIKPNISAYPFYGVEASAILYSIIETAKANGLTPFDYINHCLEYFSKSSDSVDELMPWSIRLAN